MKNKILVPCMFALLTLLTFAHGSGQTLNATFPETDGAVYALGLSDNGTIYAGGLFDHLVTLQGRMLQANTSGTVLTSLTLNGTLYAAIPDGSGGFYVAGAFDCYDLSNALTPLNKVFRLNSNGTVNSTFVAPTINGAVRSLLVVGSNLYIGGDFTTVNGSTRNHIARLSASTGSLDAGFVVSVTGGTSPSVYTMECNSTGSQVFVGGRFTTVGSSARDNIARINIGTSITVDGTFDDGTNGLVRIIRITSNDNNLYIGGDFTGVGTKTRNRIAKVSASTGTAITAWNANSNGEVYDIELITDGIITCGAFTTIGGANRKQVAKLRSDNGDAKSGFVISGTVNGDVHSITDAGSSEWYVAGAFTTFDGSTRYGLAKVDGSGSVLSWNPNATITNIYNGIAFDPNNSGSGIVGAGYSSANEVISERTGRINGSTFAPTFYDMAVVVSSIEQFAFRTSGGSSRVLAVGLNAQFLWDLTGRNSFAEWLEGGNIQAPQILPNYGGSFRGIAMNGGNAIIVGSFSSIDRYSGGSYYDTQNRNNIVEIDLSTTPVTVTSLDPNANGAVTDIVVSGGIAYVAGSFTTIGGVSRAGLAAIDLSDGSITSWDPNQNGTVYSIAPDDANGVVYLGGSFTSAGGSSRSNIACVDNSTGSAVSAWNPGANAAVLTIELDGLVVYAGGSFTTAGGSSRNFAAAFNKSNGALLSWNPDPSSAIHDILVHNSAVILGGSFASIMGCSRQGLAAVSTATGASKPVVRNASESSLSVGTIQVSPNPITGSAEIEITSPKEGFGRLDIYTLDGRKAGEIFSGEMTPDRPITASLNRSSVELAPGTYLLRLTCGDTQIVERITILQ